MAYLYSILGEWEFKDVAVLGRPHGDESSPATREGEFEEWSRRIEGFPRVVLDGPERNWENLPLAGTGCSCVAVVFRSTRDGSWRVCSPHSGVRNHMKGWVVTVMTERFGEQPLTDHGESAELRDGGAFAICWRTGDDLSRQWEHLLTFLLYHDGLPRARDPVTGPERTGRTIISPLDELLQVARRTPPPRDPHSPEEDERLCAEFRAFGIIVHPKSRGMTEVLRNVKMYAAGDRPILLLGETGTGKELLAEAIHRSSSRASGPYRIFDCTGLTEDLAWSQLFGHRKGSYTGACEDKAGAVEHAHQGTLFLDEVGDLPRVVQAKLLRFLESSEFHRLGEEERSRRVDVRVVAATNLDLKEMTARKSFREDLFYRLTTFVIRIPPLRQRLDDVEPILRHLVAEGHRKDPGHPAGIHRSAVQALRDYVKRSSCPGNVRDLRNVLARAAAHARFDGHDPIEPEDVLGEIAKETTPDAVESSSDDVDRTLRWLLGMGDCPIRNGSEARARLRFWFATLCAGLARRCESPDDDLALDAFCEREFFERASGNGLRCRSAFVRLLGNDTPHRPPHESYRLLIDAFLALKAVLLRESPARVREVFFRNPRNETRLLRRDTLEALETARRLLAEGGITRENFEAGLKGFLDRLGEIGGRRA